jgi:hypothetical protein
MGAGQRDRRQQEQAVVSADTPGDQASDHGVSDQGEEVAMLLKAADRQHRHSGSVALLVAEVAVVISGSMGGSVPQPAGPE